jgi:hypothetical protein
VLFLLGKLAENQAFLLPPNKQQKWQRACFRAHVPQREAKAEEQSSGGGI